MFNSSQLFLIDHPLRLKPVVYAAKSNPSAAAPSGEYAQCKQGQQPEWRPFTLTLMRAWNRTPTPTEAREAAPSKEPLMRNFVSLTFEPMRWGGEGWRGEEKKNPPFHLQRNHLAPMTPLQGSRQTVPVCTGDCVCQWWWRGASIYSSRCLAQQWGEKGNSLANQKRFHLSRKFNAPATVWLWLGGGQVFIWDIDHRLIYSLVQNCRRWQ